MESRLFVRICVCIFVICPVFFPHQASHAEVIPVGKGAYRDDLPPGDDGVDRRRVHAAPLIGATVNEAIPTSDWWSSLVWPVHSKHSLPMFPHPLAVQAHSQGLGLGYTPEPSISHGAREGKIYLQGTEYKYPYRESMVVGLVDSATEVTKVERFSDWSVTALWEKNTDRFRATITHGSPFVFFERESRKPIHIRFQAAKVDRTAQPIEPLVFHWNDIDAKHNGKDGEIQIAMNAGTSVGVGAKARLVYDFTGDGSIDRVETFSLFATDPIAETFETYSSEKQTLDDKLSYGEPRDFSAGSVRLEIWKCFGEGDLEVDLSKSRVRLPFSNKAVFPNDKGGFGETPTNNNLMINGFDASQGAAIVFHQDGAVLGVTLNGAHFGIFAPTGAAWTGISKGRSDAVTSSLASKDYLSVAVLPDDRVETLKWFQERAYAFVSDTRIEYQYHSKQSAVQTKFRVETVRKETTGRDETVFALYRHQHLHADQSGRFEAFKYASPRGAMKVLAGTEFSTTTPFLGVLPALPTFDKPNLTKLLRADVKEILNRNNAFEREDSYWNGKEMGKFSELIQIADHLGEYKSRDKLVELLKQRLEEWFDGHEQRFFYYDQTWGALIGYPDSYGSADQFNDHHFHYSYFIRAAATIAQFDPDWAKPENYGGMIDLLIRNCANYDRSDKRFAWMRNFDPYAGHSWASGHAGFASGNNQESSSESMNFATALILYGEVTQNQAVRDLGVFWHSTEAEAISQYWFDVDRQVFPEGYNQRCVGMVWGDGGTYGTWWTANPEEIHGINYLPINGGSLYLGRHADYIHDNYENLIRSNRKFHNTGNGDPEEIDRWRDVIAEYLALVNPGKASSLLVNHGKSFPREFGESRTHTRQWIAALEELGQFAGDIQADHPTAVAFRKGKRLRYAIFNAGSEPEVVRFSNNSTWEVDGGLHVFEHLK